MAFPYLLSSHSVFHKAFTYHEPQVLVGFTKLSNSLLFPAALQSPIEYQRKERSTAVMRSQPARVPQASPEPYSSIPVGSEKPQRAPAITHLCHP